MKTILAIVSDNKKVLIGKLKAESIKEFGGIEYVFPGGKVEDNEELEKATIREVKKETGLDVEIISKIGERIHPKTGKLIYYFHCKKVGGYLSTRGLLNDDIDTLIWIEPDELLNYMPSLFEKVITHLVRSKNSTFSPIEFIYFDVGGVAILDYSKTNKWSEMLDDLRITEEQKSKFEELFSAHESNICTGEDINIFVKEAKVTLGVKFPKDYDMTADFVSRFERNESMLNLLERIKGKFKLGLLTAQYPKMLNMIFRVGLLPSDNWEVIIDSSVEKINKPDIAIYRLAEEKAGVKPESILFVDNKAELLRIPQQRGWLTFEYDPSSAEESTRSLESFILHNSEVGF